ncbi:Amino acid permease 5 [Linum perenne]
MDPCHMNANPYMIAFGVAQFLFSQIPDFDQLSWLSIVDASVMSFTYLSVGLGLALLKSLRTKPLKEASPMSESGPPITQNTINWFLTRLVQSVQLTSTKALLALFLLSPVLPTISHHQL